MNSEIITNFVSALDELADRSNRRRLRWDGTDTTFGDTEYSAAAVEFGMNHAYRHAADEAEKMREKINRFLPSHTSDNSFADDVKVNGLIHISEVAAAISELDGPFDEPENHHLEVDWDKETGVVNTLVFKTDSKRAVKAVSERLGTTFREGHFRGTWETRKA